jgi:sulfhydrogenase subunit beta (sulfur reductase)
VSESTAQDAPRVIGAAELAGLYGALRRAGYLVIGPTVRDGAIILAELGSSDELPFGWGVSLEPGGYRLRRRDDRAAFAHSSGPQSWKQYLHPPRTRLWSAERTGDGFGVHADAEPAPRYAFLGVRPCDLRAIEVQDRVLGGGSRYAERREAAFIVAVNCTEPGEACFCASMSNGPATGSCWATTPGTTPT